MALNENYEIAYFRSVKNLLQHPLNHLLWHTRGSTLESSSVAIKADNLWLRYLRSIFFNTIKLNIGLAALNYLRFLNVLYNSRKP